jgi:hypothetical protein
MIDGRPNIFHSIAHSAQKPEHQTEKVLIDMTFHQYVSYDDYNNMVPDQVVPNSTNHIEISASACMQQI